MFAQLFRPGQKGTARIVVLGQTTSHYQKSHIPAQLEPLTPELAVEWTRCRVRVPWLANQLKSNKIKCNKIDSKHFGKNLTCPTYLSTSCLDHLPLSTPGHRAPSRISSHYLPLCFVFCVFVHGLLANSVSIQENRLRAQIS